MSYDPNVGGQPAPPPPPVGDVGAPAVQPEPTGPEKFDYTQHADKVVEITVAGQQIEVPLSEALAGYSRQADYTKKTQELAEERQALGDHQLNAQRWESLMGRLQTDPQGTLELLKHQLGVDSQSGADPYDGRDPEMVRLEAQHRETQNQLAGMQTRMRIETEKSALAAKYPDVDPDAVVAYAAQHSYPEGTLEQAYLAMQAPQLQAKLAELTAQQQSKVDELAAVTAAKQGLPQSPPPGRAPTPGEVPPDTGDAFSNAYALSLQQLDVRQQ